jgi:hypothetical protein
MPPVAAIDEFYTDDCVLYAPLGVFVGRDALDKFAGDLRATHPHFAYTPRGEAQALHNGGILAWGSGLRGKPFPLHRAGRHHCPRRKDCCAIRFPQSETLVALHDTQISDMPGHKLLRGGGRWIRNFEYSFNLCSKITRVQ